ncbi:hypothetical protein V6R21_14555 [Limibacter armeniacum]|uniref:hypothetical protein n=1 Tax=Limibacter armeniacum TaxID=466084 RepID=UPI002FE50085
MRMSSNLLRRSVSIITIAAISTFMYSCTGIYHVGAKRPVYRSSGSSSKSIPPGQMKKMTGSKSAKSYAPGQRKKH